MTNAATDADGTIAPTAVVFIQGLHLGPGKGKTATGAVRSIVRGCRQQTTGPTVFDHEWTDLAVNGVAASVTGMVATVVRTDGTGSPQRLVDIYSYEWAAPFIANWEKRNAFVRFAKSFFALIGARRFVAFFNTAGKKNPKGRAQLIAALCLVGLVAAYAIVAAVAVYQVVATIVEERSDDSEETGTDETAATASSNPTTDSTPATTTAPSGTSADSDNASDDSWWPPTIPQSITIVVGAVLLAARKSRKKFIETGGVVAAAESYLRIGDGQENAVGGLENLLDVITGSAENKRVIIVAYSFGSLVAIDTLFPASGEPTAVAERVDTLVTIGSPFDFARAVRPTWAQGRNHGAKPSKWMNVYSDIDLLGSNFRDDTVDGGPDLSLTGAENLAELATAAERGAPTRQYRWNSHVKPTFVNLLQFHGFNNHGGYWDDDGNPPVDGVFDEIVKVIFEGDAVLAPAPTA